MEWLWAFLFTQAVEIPVYVLGLRAKFDEAFGASAVTHPIVWFVIPPLWDWLYLALLAPHPSLWMTPTTRYWVMVVIAESFAISGEALYFRLLRKKKTWRWSFAANMASVTLGLLSREIFGVP
jgi:hypothetical protein